jgi:hypothetical protein
MPGRRQGAFAPPSSVVPKTNGLPTEARADTIKHVAGWAFFRLKRIRPPGGASLAIALWIAACSHAERITNLPPVQGTIGRAAEAAVDVRDAEPDGAAGSSDLVGRLWARGVRVGVLDTADPRFPDDWRDFDAFTFRDGVDHAPNPVEMVWWSDYLDGHLWIVVTNRHIYIHSGHDNPNPNYLYWVGPSTEVQRNALEAAVKGIGKGGPFDCLAGLSSADGGLRNTGALQCSARVSHHDTRADGKMKHYVTAAANVAELFVTIHRSWPADVPRLPLPDATALESSVFLFTRPDELEDRLARCRRDGDAGRLVTDSRQPCPF